VLAGRPLVSYALDVFRACREVGQILLVVAPEDVERARAELLRPGGPQSERVVAGGEERQQSVAAALGEIGPGCDLVVVHDGARPFVKPELIDRCIEAAAEHGAAIAAIPATDTVKEAGADRRVTATFDRSRIWLVQTPQAFRRELLARAHEAASRAGLRGTDDASLVENLGHTVHLVMGAEDRPLVLAGVRLREERGLLGHSDADVVCHAICDALLGAIGEGDIGRHFPDSDPKYAGISSLLLLRRVSDMMRAQGWEIENVDAVVIAEAPPIAPHLPDMRRALAQAMGTEPTRVNVKGKTTEGMGFTGRREGIASQAIAVLRPRYISRANPSPEE